MIGGSTFQFLRYDTAALHDLANHVLLRQGIYLEPVSVPILLEDLTRGLYEILKAATGSKRTPREPRYDESG